MPDAWIRPWGDPALRQPAPPVRALDDILRAQVRRMIRVLEEAAGAGLAATQVGVLRRLFVFRTDPEDPVGVLVNPRVVACSAELATFHEGCLSFPSVVVAVRRPAAVRIEGAGLDGRVRTIEAEGFAASLLQHETDHLDGILTLDRADTDERRRAIGVLLALAA